MATESKEITFLGEKAIQAGNDQLELILVPSWGSRVISLMHKAKGLQVLRVPASVEAYAAEPILYGIPILFPPNRIGDGMFTYNGRVYHLTINETERHNHIHGFLHDKKWNLVQVQASQDTVTLQTEFDSSWYPELYEQFPHPFAIRMTYKLESNTLYKEATIENRGEEPFPWGFGYHTTFLFPETGTFALTAEKRWKLNERLLPTGELEEIAFREALQQGMSLKNWPLDDVFLSSVCNDGPNEARLVMEEKGLRITYRCDDHFKHWVVYNGDAKQGFLCPEPYTWVTNAPNLALPSSLTGLQVLPPGQQVTIRAAISVDA